MDKRKRNEKQKQKIRVSKFENMLFVHQQTDLYTRIISVSWSLFRR